MLPGKLHVPGFPTRAAARRAAQKFFAKTDGTPGVQGRDFYLIQNNHSRWEFAEGKAPKSSDPA